MGEATRIFDDPKLVQVCEGVIRQERRKQAERYLRYTVDRITLRAAHDCVVAHLRDWDQYEPIDGNLTTNPSDWSWDFLERIVWICRAAELYQAGDKAGRERMIEALKS